MMDNQAIIQQLMEVAPEEAEMARMMLTDLPPIEHETEQSESVPRASSVMAVDTPNPTDAGKQ